MASWNPVWDMMACFAIHSIDTAWPMDCVVDHMQPNTDDVSRIDNDVLFTDGPLNRLITKKKPEETAWNHHKMTVRIQQLPTN